MLSKKPTIKKSNARQQKPQTKHQPGQNSNLSRRNLTNPPGNSNSMQNYNKSTSSAYSVTNTEIASGLLGTTTQGGTKYEINPGSSTLFPWLSEIARHYNCYKFKKLAFRYVPTVSGYSPAGQQGQVFLAFTPDVLDTMPGSIVSISQYSQKTQGLPCESQCLTIDLKMPNSLDAKFIRGPYYPASSDPKTYDIGALFAFVSGTNNTSAIGLVYVDYTVDFYDPITSINNEFPIPVDVYSAFTTISFTTVKAGVWESAFDAAWTVTVDGLGLGSIPANMPPGYFQVTLVATESSNHGDNNYSAGLQIQNPNDASLATVTTILDASSSSAANINVVNSAVVWNTTTGWRPFDVRVFADNPSGQTQSYALRLIVQRL